MATQTTSATNVYNKFLAEAMITKLSSTQASLNSSIILDGKIGKLDTSCIMAEDYLLHSLHSHSGITFGETYGHWFFCKAEDIEDVEDRINWYAYLEPHESKNLDFKTIRAAINRYTLNTPVQREMVFDKDGVLHLKGSLNITGTATQALKSLGKAMGNLSGMDLGGFVTHMSTPISPADPLYHQVLNGNADSLKATLMDDITISGNEGRALTLDNFKAETKASVDALCKEHLPGIVRNVMADMGLRSHMILPEHSHGELLTNMQDIRHRLTMMNVYPDLQEGTSNVEIFTKFGP